ncbi:MAG: phosphonate ABC transporter ATP-binding protein [Gammaproteobacteria bacterium]|nr:phosphonate ABC transporter ATP-binding protein [Gammaproteobacteria bacterium]MCP5424054.1 phosphonate ABC transporter ATP-binding protein [Gammaproteobacteria bacterium]
MASAIRITELSKTYGHRKALDNIDLAVEAGEMVALIGASGSGKSTLLRHIAGLVTADRRDGGEITVLDRHIQRAGRLSSNIRRQRARIGMVFQQFNLINRLSVLTNVLAGTLGRIPVWRGVFTVFSRREKHQAMQALARVGMAEWALQRAANLSGGQQQRVAIARTLVQEAEIILADEPIASLDPESSRRVMKMLARINQEDGKTVMVSLHQVDYALKYCSRTVALKDGRITYDGPSHALTPELLDTLYGTVQSTDDAPRLEYSSESSRPASFASTDILQSEPADSVI